MDINALSAKINNTLTKLGQHVHIVSLATGKTTSFIGVWGKDNEADLNETAHDPSHLITRKRILYITGSLSYVPVPGDSVIDKMEKVSQLPADNITSIGGYSYHVNSVDRYRGFGALLAYKLEIEG